MKFLATCQGYSHTEISIQQLNAHREVSPFSLNELVILLCVMHLYCFVSDLLCVQKFLCILENSDFPCYAEHVSMFNSVIYKRKHMIILYWPELLNFEENGNSAYKIKIYWTLNPVFQWLKCYLKCWSLLLFFHCSSLKQISCSRMLYIAVTDWTKLMWSEYIIIHTPTKSLRVGWVFDSLFCFFF